MDFTFYVAVVAIAALIYAILVRLIQDKFGNKTQMQEFQEKSKKLSEEYDKATKSKDTARIEQLNKEQFDLMPEMNKVMMGSFAAVIPVLIIYFYWLH